MNNQTPINIRIGEVIKELEESEGAQISSSIRRLGMSYFIFMGNYSELKNAVDTFREPAVALPLWMEGNEQELEAYQYNTVRLLHNFLASAKALVDHMRIIVNEVFKNNSAFLKEYQDKVNREFKDNPMPQVVHELRNYILHLGLKPFTKATFHLTNPPDWSLVIDVVELRKWNRWDATNRAYLATLDDEIKVDDLINPYADIVIRFHSWFDERQSQINEEAYNKTNEIKRRLSTLVDPSKP